MLARFRESALRLNILENSYDEFKSEKHFVENSRIEEISISKVTVPD